MEKVNKESLWESVMAELKISLSGANFQTWFKGKTGILSINKGLVEIGCANSYNKVWIEERYQGQLKEIVGRIVGQPAALVFSVSPEVVSKKEKPRKETADTVPLFEDAVPASIKEVLDRANINQRFSFPNFIVGRTNQLAYAVSKAVVENSFGKYNPLLIHGGVGVGKTHLLQAIAQGVVLRKSSTKVLYASSETFTNEMIEAIQSKQTVAFRKKYRNIDLLIIDDVQFIAGRESTQEEFFHTFNQLILAGKQVVISCDRNPDELSNLQTRLKSRFGGGMSVLIEPPDKELREAVLLAKSKEAKINIDFSDVRFLAENLGPSIRELEGALLRLSAVSRLTGKKIDASLIKTAIKLKDTSQRSPSDVVSSVAGFFSLSANDLKSSTRKSDFVFPRQVAMYLLRNVCSLTYTQVASHFGGRDRSTVIYSVHKVENLMEKGGEVSQIVGEVRDKIFGG